MKRLDLPVATRRPAADAARIPAYIGTPERVAASQMTAFTTVFQTHTGRTFASHADLHDCSVREFRTFWHCFLHWTPGIDWSGDAEPVCVGDECEHATFFPNVTLNYADNLLGLSIAGADAPAITACHADGSHVRIDARRTARARRAPRAGARGTGPARRRPRGRRDAQRRRRRSSRRSPSPRSARRFRPPRPRWASRRSSTASPSSSRACCSRTRRRAHSTSACRSPSKIAALAAGLPTLAGVVCLDDEAAARARCAAASHARRD